MSDERMVSFEHDRFGKIEIPEIKLIHCDGLPGFPEARRLVIMEHDGPACFAWLLCLELPALAFTVADPCQFYPEYSPKAHLSDLRAISASPEDDLDVLVIVNVTGDGTFLNLAAPLLVNPEKHLAIQAILAEGSWPVRAPLRGGTEPRADQIESNPQR